MGRELHRGGAMEAVEPNAGPGAPVDGGRRRDRLWRRAILGIIAVVAIAYAITELNPSCLWEKVQDNVELWRSWAAGHPAAALFAFFLVYATFTALPLPVVTVMCLLAGALFDRTAGTVVASLGYTTGVTAAFLASRWLLRDRIR